MKKTFIILAAVIALASAGFVIRQNLPSKRFARQILKARELVRAQDFLRAKEEYQKAYQISGEYSPWVSLEVLRLENALILRDKSFGAFENALANTRIFLEAHPHDPEAWLLLSQLNLENGDFTGAFSAITSLLNFKPDHFGSRRSLAVLHLQQGRLDLAEAQFRILVEAHPDSITAMLPLAGTLFREGKTIQAREFLRKAAAIDSSLRSAHELLADTYIIEKKFDSALQVLEEWAARDDSARVSMNVRKARLYCLSGRMQDAEKTLYPFLKPSLDNLPAIAEMAMIKVKQGEYLAAINKYEDIAKNIPKMSHRAWFMAHLLYLKAEKPAQSLEVLKRLTTGAQGVSYARNFVICYLALDMEHMAKAYIADQSDSLKQALKGFRHKLVNHQDYYQEWALVNFFQMNNEHLWALKTLDGIYTRWPDNILAAETYISALVSAYQYEPALRLLESIPRPSIPMRQLRLSLCQKTGKEAQAISEAMNLLKEYPKLAGTRIFLADYYLQKGDKAKSEELLLEELEMNPGNTLALNNLAWDFGIERNDFSKAEPYIQAIINQNPSDPRILDTVGWILAVHGKYPEAEKYLGLAVGLFPDHPSMLYHLAWLKNRLNDNSSAEKLLKKALAGGRAFSERKDAETLLGAL